MRSFGLVFFFGCQDASFSELERFTIEQMRLPEDIPLDESNQWDGKSDAILFGEQLFFSEELSPHDISCASCHAPELGFADGRTLAQGVGEAGRHSPTLYGVAFQTWFRWDGGCDSMWCQAVGPIESPVEMGSSRADVALAIQNTPQLLNAYTEIFGELPNIQSIVAPAMPNAQDPISESNWNALSSSEQDSLTEILVNVSKSLAAYERTLTPAPTRFDQFVDVFLEDEKEALSLLSLEEEHGLRLFIGEGGCHFCHNGPMLSNDSFHNIGLGPRAWLDGTDIGRYDGITLLRDSDFNAAGRWSDAPQGVRARRIERLKQSTEQLSQFKTPTLRNLSQTAPYMHGGHFETLEDVLINYSELGESPLQGHTDETLKPLNWSELEIEAVHQFLQLFDER